jgi:hypothetical protein
MADANSYRTFYHRISILVALPTTSLDRLALRKRLDEIGQSVPSPEKV